jgi:hypothetical protein
MGMGIDVSVEGSNVGRFDNLDAEHEAVDYYQGVHRRIGGGFFRGAHCNFTPLKTDFDLDSFLGNFVLKGWTPERPFVSKETRVTTFGSCFAEHVAKYLGSLGYDLSKDRDPMVYISRMSEGMVNTYAILQQFEWALEKTKPSESLWHGYRCEEFGYDEEIRKRTEQVFLETQVFIITLGLSEIWYDEATGGVFWRGVPMKFYDASRHKFRVCSFNETKGNIQRIYELIRKHVPHAKVLFTLSPIPLAATFRPTSIITANSASKAILRAALDEFYRDNSTDLNKILFYFPAFEIVNELFLDRFELDLRHVHPHIITFVMKLFEAVYCDGDLKMTGVDALLRQARKSDVTVTTGVPRTLRNLILFFRGRLTTTRFR